jgi:hypothetical protein
MNALQSSYFFTSAHRVSEPRSCLAIHRARPNAGRFCEIERTSFTFATFEASAQAS